MTVVDINRVLVTGANGFVGSHVVEALERNGLAVRALVRRTSRLANLEHSRAELAYGDTSDPASLLSALDGVQGVVHCAGLTRALSAGQYLGTNRDGTANLLKLCTSLHARPPRIVCLSSLAAYGPSSAGHPAREEDKQHPVSDYGMSKLEGQRVAESFMKELPVSVLIPPAVYGPRDRDILVYFKFVRMGFVPFLGRTERFISLIFVKDLAAAAVRCLLSEKAAGRSYFVDDGEIQSWETFARAIARAMHKRPVSVAVPGSLAGFLAAGIEACFRMARRPPLLGIQKMHELLQPSWTCTGERIRNELGLQIEYPLDRGLAETARWYAEHKWL